MTLGLPAPYLRRADAYRECCEKTGGIWSNARRDCVAPPAEQAEEAESPSRGGCPSTGSGAVDAAAASADGPLPGSDHARFR
jgi:hypothetical protein